MAVETLISPGVLARENDQSFITAGPISVGAAIIGPTARGPVEKPTVVTSYSEFVNKFGSIIESGSDTYTYFTSITAYNYFQNGGRSLLVARVVRNANNYTAATASIDTRSVTSGKRSTASIAISDIDSTSGAYTAYGVFSAAGNNPSIKYIFVATSSVASPQTDNTAAKIFFFASGSTAAATATNLANKINNTSTYHPLSASANSNTVGISSSIDLATTFNDSYILGSASAYFTTPIGSYFPNISFGGGVAPNYTQSFVLETIAEGAMMNSYSTADFQGALPSGSANNIRYQITSVDINTGTFDMVIRRGNDTSRNIDILQTFTNLSLDPKSSNFISRQIGDSVENYNSATNQMVVTGNFPNTNPYVRVKKVNTLTPDYLDNNGSPKSIYTGSLPRLQAQGFGGASGDPFDSNLTTAANFYENISATNTQGLYYPDYINMIALLSNKDDYQFNMLFTPGIYRQDYADLVSTIITNTQDRGDNIYVADLVPYGSSVSSVTSEAASVNSSYTAAYWPWVQISDPSTGNLVWVPASTMIAGVYAYTDSVSEPWFAPAGINRGLLGAVRAEQKLPQAYRDTLYNGKVNPIATFPGQGVVVYGQKTLQTKASALDRVNVRRLLIALKSYITQVADTLVFEPNTATTRNNFLAQVNPYLESVQQRQGLYAYRVIMDDSNNTPDVIDQNKLVGQIYIQPTKTAEFIYLDFIITRTGVTFG